MNGLRIVSLYLKKGNYKLVSLIVILGLACSLYMMAFLVRNSYSNDSMGLDKDQLIVSNISNYSYIEPNVLEEVKQISGITKVTAGRVINMFLSFDDSSKDALGSYEFIIVPQVEVASDLIFQKSLRETFDEMIMDRLICSYQGGTIAIESDKIIYQDHEELPNHISENLVRGFWELDVDVLPVKNLAIEIDSAIDEELLLKELIKYGLKPQNSDRDKLQSFIATEHRFINVLFYVLIGLVVVITGQLLKLLFRSRKQNIGIIRIIGYSKKTVILMMLLEYFLIFILSMIVMMLCIFMELLIVNYGFGMGINLNIRTFFKGYKDVFATTFIVGSVINVLLCIWLTSKNNLNIIKTEVRA